METQSDRQRMLLQVGCSGKASEEVKYGQAPEQSEGVNHVPMWGKNKALNGNSDGLLLN